MSEVNAYQINWSKSFPKRSGIILYHEGQYYLGIDSLSGDVTDFGGSTIYSFEDAIQAAVREFGEETLYCFPLPTWEELYESEVLIDDDVAIFIYKTPYDPSSFIKLFEEKRCKRKYNEISSILTLTQAKEEAKKIYSVIRKCIELIM